jgi:hypothetical protein
MANCQSCYVAGLDQRDHRTDLDTRLQRLCNGLVTECICSASSLQAEASEGCGAHGMHRKTGNMRSVVDVYEKPAAGTL